MNYSKHVGFLWICKLCGLAIILQVFDNNISALAEKLVWNCTEITDQVLALSEQLGHNTSMEAIKLQKSSQNQNTTCRALLAFVESESGQFENELSVKLLQKQVKELTEQVKFYAELLQILKHKHKQKIRRLEQQIRTLERQLAVFARNQDGIPRTPNNVLVELLIVCDQSFVMQFDNNLETIYNFWSTQMWDVNMRMKTLSMNNIIVEVVKIHLIQESEGQPFMENLNKTVDYRRRLLHSFAEWLYENEMSFAPFDVAILASGDYCDFLPNTGWTYAESVCQKNNEIKQHGSSSLLIYKFPYQRFTSRLANSIVIQLGSPRQFCSFQLHPPGGSDYNNGRFFFGRCVDEALTAHLQKPESKCVYQRMSPTFGVLDKYNHVVPPSFDEQCKIATNIHKAFAIKTPDSCLTTNCYNIINGTKTFVTNLTVVDNTPCATNKLINGLDHCFRGRCLPIGFQFRNEYINWCVRSSNRFAANDNITSADCQKTPTPLDTLRIDTHKTRGQRLIAPFGATYTNENLDKCLTVNNVTMTVQFQKCSNSSAEFWSLIIEKTGSRKVLIYHHVTRSCLVMDAYGLITPSLDCDAMKSQFLWSIVDQENLPDKFYTQTLINLVGITIKCDCDPNGPNYWDEYTY